MIAIDPIEDVPVTPGHREQVLREVARSQDAPRVLVGFDAKARFALICASVPGQPVSGFVKLFPVFDAVQALDCVKDLVPGGYEPRVYEFSLG